MWHSKLHWSCPCCRVMLYLIRIHSTDYLTPNAKITLIKRMWEWGKKQTNNLWAWLVFATLLFIMRLTITLPGCNWQLRVTKGASGLENPLFQRHNWCQFSLPNEFTGYQLQHFHPDCSCPVCAGQRSKSLHK